MTHRSTYRSTPSSFRTFRIASLGMAPLFAFAALTLSPSASAGGSSNATIIGGDRMQGQVIQAGGRSGASIVRSSRASSSPARSTNTARRDLGFASGSAGRSGAGYSQPGGRRASGNSRTITPSVRAQDFTERFDSLRQRFRRQTFGQVPGTRSSASRQTSHRQIDFREGPRARLSQFQQRRTSRTVDPRRTNPASSFSRNSRQRFRR